MAQLYISASNKSSGKTVVSMGICAALRDKGLTVQPFKKGPDYIDPLWLARAAQRECINLDFNTMNTQQLEETFFERVSGADVVLIEGNKGLYDGVDLDGSNSNAALAQLLDLPVILVIDTVGMTRGIAPLLIGYQSFVPKVNIFGVILNKVGGERHQSKLMQVIEYYTDIPILGSVPRHQHMLLEERHIGLIPSNELADADGVIEGISNTVAEHVDLDKLVNVTDRDRQITSRTAQTETSLTTVTIGVARDKAFGFYYPDDLEALEKNGADIVFFDTIKDTKLPKIDGLFIGGGFPETNMRALESNHQMRQDILAFVKSNGPVYAECGGLMYLARTLSWDGKCHDMVGALPVDVEMRKRPVGRGYTRLKETGLLPWGKISVNSEQIPAHEFHYSRVVNTDEDARFAFEVTRGFGFDGSNDGLIHKNTVATYSHLRNMDPVRWVQRFLDFVRSVKGESVNDSRH